MIEVRDLVKRYGDRNAVDHLSFTVEDGQIFGFLGPNGAGKTTTMNIMTGYLAATGGQVLVEGHDILEEPEAAKACIGYLPELPPLYPDMTVEEYLAFCAELKRIPRPEQEEQLDQVLALTHLEEMSARLIRNLSKGYRQRVGLAQAILGFPKIIILDEPTVGLDPKQVVEIRELIRHLAGLAGDIISAAKEYNPAIITRYVIDLATLFHKFYNACPVKSAPDHLKYPRIALCIATKTVLENVLTLLKIDAPDEM